MKIVSHILSFFLHFFLCFFADDFPPELLCFLYLFHCRKVFSLIIIILSYSINIPIICLRFMTVRTCSAHSPIFSSKADTKIGERRCEKERKYDPSTMSVSSRYLIDCRYQCAWCPTVCRCGYAEGVKR